MTTSLEYINMYNVYTTCLYTTCLLYQVLYYTCLKWNVICILPKNCTVADLNPVNLPPKTGATLMHNNDLVKAKIKLLKFQINHQQMRCNMIIFSKTSTIRWSFLCCYCNLITLQNMQLERLISVPIIIIQLSSGNHGATEQPNTRFHGHEPRQLNMSTAQQRIRRKSLNTTWQRFKLKQKYCGLE